MYVCFIYYADQTICRISVPGSYVPHERGLPVHICLSVTVLDRFRSYYDLRCVAAGAATFTAPPPICGLPLLLLLPSGPPLGGPTCCLDRRYRPGHKAIRTPSIYKPGRPSPSVRSTIYLYGSWLDLRLVLLCSLLLIVAL